MNARQIKLVQDSFANVVPITATAAELFYQRLFELDPALRKLFKGDMQQQGIKLMAMIAAAVRGLNDIDKLVPVLQDLGKRHGGYGVKAKDYDTVGSAFLWTLEKGLGTAFTPEVRDAWAVVYAVIGKTMIAASLSAATTDVTTGASLSAA